MVEYRPHHRDTFGLDETITGCSFHYRRKGILMPHDVQKRFLLTLSFTAALLTGCSSIAAQSAPTAAPAAAAPTALPHVTRAPISATATMAATATAAPTSEPTTTPTAEPTAAPTQPPPIPVGDALVLERGSVPQRLYAVMIDNHPAAYPQSGLDKAPLVFEALAEFGITRYMAVFAPGISPQASAIGPVRSARSYYVQWAIGLQAIYAHAGGSPDGLALAQESQSIVNADALRKDAGKYFRRDKSRKAPHNLYTDSTTLARIVADRNAAAFDPTSIGFLFKAEAPAAQRPAKQRFSYYFLYKDEIIDWVYDPQQNIYLRIRRGKAHVDGQTGKQLAFKNIVVMEVPEAARAGDAKGRIDQDVVGEGTARVFMDGTEIQARWRKESNAAQLRFYDDSDTEIAFDIGPIWIAALPTLSHLTIK